MRTLRKSLEHMRGGCEPMQGSRKGMRELTKAQSAHMSGCGSRPFFSLSSPCAPPGSTLLSRSTSRPLSQAVGWPLGCSHCVTDTWVASTRDLSSFSVLLSSCSVSSCSLLRSASRACSCAADSCSCLALLDSSDRCAWVKIRVKL